MNFEPGLYRNKKTRVVYLATGTRIDCTNSRDGTVVVLYGNDYVRELNEFLEKFEKESDEEPQGNVL